MKEGPGAARHPRHTETNRKIQFTVDKETKRSYIDLEDLEKREAISFKSHY